MARVTDSDNWFGIWFDGKKAMIDTMTRNMASDLANGYDYFGKSISKQRTDIERYQREFDQQMEDFKYMEDKQVNRWCFYDMKKRGVID